MEIRDLHYPHYPIIVSPETGCLRSTTPKQQPILSPPDGGQCANPISLQVEVYDDFDFEIENFCLNGHFYLEAVYENATTNWRYNNTSVGHDAVFDVTAYLNSTTEIETMPLTFDVTVTNANGCDKTKSIELRNVYCDIQRGISPNDDLLNDFFDLRLLDVSHLSIFNRYGIKVYSKNGYRDEWHGQTDGGTILPDGVYYYVIDLIPILQKQAGFISTKNNKIKLI